MYRERVSRSPGTITYWNTRQRRQPLRNTTSNKNYITGEKSIAPQDRVMFNRASNTIAHHRMKNIIIHHNPKDIHGIGSHATKSMSWGQEQNEVNIAGRRFKKQPAMLHELGHHAMGHVKKGHSLFTTGGDTYKQEVDAWTFARKEADRLHISKHEKVELLKDKVKALNTYRKGFGMRQHRV